MKYIQGQDRNQLALFPDLIDSRIDEENSVRTVDVSWDLLSKELVAVDGSKFKAWKW